MIITSMREVRRILTDTSLSNPFFEIDTSEGFTPNPSFIYMRLGNGLVMYEPYGSIALGSVVVHSIEKGLYPKIKQQFEILKDMGFTKVHAHVHPKHRASRFFCKSVAKMKQAKKTDEGKLIYEAVLNGQE